MDTRSNVDWDRDRCDRVSRHVLEDAQMNRYIFAIDPGTTDSAYVIIDTETLRPMDRDIVSNEEMLERIDDASYPYYIDHINIDFVIEMVASYGKPVGKDVFETCRWIGRFAERIAMRTKSDPAYVYRIEEKRNLCHSSSARDSYVIQALIDRFASGVPNKGKGSAKEPGWFYGFKKDIWQAYAVGITFYDRENGGDE